MIDAENDDMETVESQISPQQIFAAVEQLSLPELEQLIDHAIALQAARKAPHATATESALLAQINQVWPAEVKARMHALLAKRDAGVLLEAEADELIELTDQLEEWHAARMQALADLARLRGLTLTALMDQLGVHFPDHD
jgi:hypothetical protein